MLTRRFDREIMLLALPALGALAADPLVSLVDTAFVGRLGPEPLAALGVCTALFSLTFFAFNFLTYGTTPRVARAAGRGDEHGAGAAVMQALVLAAVLGVSALLLMQLLAVPALKAMGASSGILGPALTYMRIRLLAAPAVTLILAANGAYRGFSDTRTPLWVSLVLNSLNIILDAALIFGAGLGLAGAAWATVIAQWTGALLFLWLLLRRDRQLLGSGPLRLPRPQELLPFLKVGWELAVRTLALLLTLTVATAVATRIGVLEVAVHQVAQQLWLFLTLTVDALAIAAQALIPRYLGGGRPADATRVADRLLVLAVLVGVGLLSVFWLSRNLLGPAFTDDPAVTAGLLRIFPFVMLMQPLNAVVFVLDGILMGLEDFRYLAFAMIASAVTAVLFLLLVQPLGLGLAGVWWGLTVLMAVRLLTTGLRWRKLRRPAATG